MLGRYLDPLTDFGFKRLFGSEANKDLLVALLNALLPADRRVATLEFRATEQLGWRAEDRKAIFDVYCISDAGERFIVEVQRARQTYFKDRSLFYATFPLQEQAQRGDWDFRLAPVYVVALLDFTFDAVSGGDYYHVVELKDQRGATFYDKWQLLYVELPRFRKRVGELDGASDEWLYVLKHLGELEAPPAGLSDMAFEKLFEEARVENLGFDERQAYEISMKAQRDNKNVADYARAQALEEGREQGREQGREAALLEVGRNLLNGGMPVTQVARATGLTTEAVAELALPR